MAAIKAKLLIPTGKVCAVTVEGNENFLPNFTWSEFANNKAKEDVKLVMDTERAWKFARMIQVTRDKYGSMTANSVYRTKTYNKSVGGDVNSCHLRCWAFDWKKPNQTNEQRKEVAQWWESLCNTYCEIGAINYYTNGYHLEIGSDVQYGNKTFVIRDYRGTSKDW